MTIIPTSHTDDDLDVGPCPAWCTLPTGHPWDSTWPDGTVSRGHEGSTESVTDPDGDRAYVSLSALERRGHGVGRVGVSVDADATLIAAQARELAALLLAAADRLPEAVRAVDRLEDKVSPLTVPAVSVSERVGSTVRDRMRLADVSAALLAEQTGIPEPTLDQRLAGEGRGFTMDELAATAAVLGVLPSELLGGC